MQRKKQGLTLLFIDLVQAVLQVFGNEHPRAPECHIAVSIYKKCGRQAGNAVKIGRFHLGVVKHREPVPLLRYQSGGAFQS